MNRKPHKWLPNCSASEGRVWRILYLANGEPVSYEDLLRRTALDHSMGVSGRNTLKQHIAKLRKAGFIIKNVRDEGYKLIEN